MKITIQLVLVIVLLFVSQNIHAQGWWPDTPTPAEITARDKPFLILQNEIKNKLCNKDWGVGEKSFLFYKDDPELNEILRGTSIHYFDLIIWGNKCTVELKQTSPLFNAYIENAKKLNERLDSIINTGVTTDKAYADALKNNGNIPTKDKALLKKKKIAKDKCFNEMTSLGNTIQLAIFNLRINYKWVDAFDAKQEEFNSDVIKHIAVSGVRQAILLSAYPDKDEPDTAYTAVLYIGNWPKLQAKRASFPFKYSTKTAWIDKAHSGPPIIENFRIRMVAYSYDKMMKVIHSIDWTKLEALIKK